MFLDMNCKSLSSAVGVSATLNRTNEVFNFEMGLKMILEVPLRHKGLVAAFMSARERSIILQLNLKKHDQKRIRNNTANVLKN